MSFTMITGLIIIAVSIICSSIIVFISTKRINTISTKGLSSLREINREFNNAK